MLPALSHKSDNALENIELPVLDPFFYESVTFSYKNSEFLDGNFTIKNVKTYGMSRGKVRNVKSDFSDDLMTIHADVFFPKIFANGHYKSNMSLSAFRIESKGQYNITMRDVSAKWSLKGKLENQDDGEAYMKLYQFEIVPEVNDMKVSVSGIFPDENLSKSC